ncbi:MAG: PIG-L family deacetylase [Chloroflexota bacterium]
MTGEAQQETPFAPRGPLLVVGAHPDDTEFAAGGTIAVFTEAGQAVHYAVLTNGSKGTKDRALAGSRLVELRRDEQRAAGTALGVVADNIHFLEQTDGELVNSPELRVSLARLIRRIRPHVLAGHDPWRPYQLHPDHRAAGFATTDAMVAARDHLYVPELWAAEHLEPYDVPEIWLFGAEVADHWVDISTTFERKLAAIRCHVTQVRDPEGLATRMREGAARVGEARGLAFAEAYKRLLPR